MPRGKKDSTNHPFDALMARAAELISAGIAAAVSRAPKALKAVKDAGAGNGRRKSARKGKKLDMRCRYPGCKNKSKGPRFRFLCEDHVKLSKKEQDAAIADWNK